MGKRFHVAILGATGAVGRELVRVLEERDFPVEKLTLLASPKSEGEVLDFRGEDVTVRAVSAERFQGAQIALFSPGAAVSKEWAPVAAGAGAVVIDDSPAFRMEPDVPLVVPEVNPDTVSGAKRRNLLANPSCAAIELAVVLKPLHDAAGIERVVASTYQSVSGRGQKGVVELEKQIADLMNARETEAEVFPHRVAFNVIPHIGDFEENGYTKEELKLVDETRKILASPSMRVTATSVRVPVFFGHSISANVTTARKMTAAEAREVLRRAPGVKLLDEPTAKIYPMPMLATGDDSVHVGRIREDLSQDKGLDLFICADNMRKGAALNAVQIAELLVERGIV